MSDLLILYFPKYLQKQFWMCFTMKPDIWREQRSISSNHLTNLMFFHQKWWGKNALWLRYSYRGQIREGNLTCFGADGEGSESQEVGEPCRPSQSIAWWTGLGWAEGLEGQSRADQRQAGWILREEMIHFCKLLESWYVHDESTA